MISLAARDRKLTERLLLALRRQTVIGHALSVRAIAPFHPHFARQRHPAQVDLAVVRDDAAALVAVAGGEGAKRHRFAAMGQRHQDLHPHLGVKVGADNRPMGGHHADHRIVKVDIVRQGVGIQRDPVFTILSGIRQDGIPAPVGAYPGLVFHFHAAGAGLSPAPRYRLTVGSG